MAAIKKTTAAATSAAAPTLTYAAATAQRQDAAQRHAAALVNLNNAEEALAGLRQRLSNGDASVTASDLASADADIERHNLLAHGAAAALSKAKAAEAPLAAEHLAQVLAPIVAPTTMDKAQARAVDTITTALVELAELAEEQRATLSRAIRMAQEVGLPGTGDVTLAHVLMDPVLMVRGRLVQPQPVSGVVASALAEAANGAGWQVRGDLELRAVEAPRETSHNTFDYGPTWEEAERLMQKAEAIARTKAERADALQEQGLALHPTTKGA